MQVRQRDRTANQCTKNPAAVKMLRVGKTVFANGAQMGYTIHLVN